MKRAHIFVSGRVQGVFFRAFAKNEAERLGLIGFIRNLSNERVEIIAEGGADELNKFVDILKTKHPIAVITKIDVKWSDAKNEFSEFEIRR